MSTPNHQLRAPGASEAHTGVSSLNSGAATRLAYGGAGLSGRRVNLVGEARRDRDAAIRRAYEAGLTARMIAEEFGLTSARIVQILNEKPGFVARRDRRGTRAALDARRDAMLVDYEAGFSLREVAARHGLTGPSVYAALRKHPEFKSRSGKHWPVWAACFVVPSWVPERHAGRYQAIAAADGEDVAAGCIRRMKALEARA